MPLRRNRSRPIIQLDLLVRRETAWLRVASTLASNIWVITIEVLVQTRTLSPIAVDAAVDLADRCIAFDALERCPIVFRVPLTLPVVLC